MLRADGPADVAANAFLKLCKLDVRDETEKWARTGKPDVQTELIDSTKVLAGWPGRCGYHTYWLSRHVDAMLSIQAD
jgi:hypothetical protein